MNQQTQLGERLQMLKAARKFARQSEADAWLRTLKAARKFARQSEADAWLRIRTASDEISQQDREAHAECNEALRIIQREVDHTRAQFLDTFYQ